MYTQICKKCDIERSFDFFAWEGKRYRLSCKICREKERRIRRQEIRETRLPKVRAYNEINREKLNRQARERRLNNPSSAIAQRMHALKRRGVAGIYTLNDIEWLWEYQNGKCNYCPAILGEVLYHIDHIIPIKLNGTNEPLNLQILCAKCNMRKGAQNPIEYENSIGIKNQTKQYMDNIYKLEKQNDTLQWVLVKGA